ncbi:MAG: alpha-glucan family phosphorylase [Gemmatimonadota bacterium]|nr:alpha-glucan family phosphorylase [Gemmatimonadota bacterium]
MNALRRKIPILPPRLEGLATLATNLAWSWNREARALFRAIDEPLWRLTRHNPIALLRRVAPARLERLATSPGFLAQYDSVLAWQESERSATGTWFARRHGDMDRQPVAYFCAEFGFHTSVPIYSGGLGVLAGDHCKASSDLGVPLVGIGLFYMKGYFDQRLRLDGWQEDSDAQTDPMLTPLTPVYGPDGEAWVTTVETFGRPVHVRAWTMQVGRAPIFLLDTDLEQNAEADRPLLSKLYAGGPDLRLRQEWILGVGGVRVLRAAGLTPGAWHANEGHAGFMMVERVRELTAAGTAWDDAVTEVRRSTIFTTHTPVAAGHDIFDADQVATCSGPVWEELGISREEFLALGSHPVREPNRFHMTVLAMNLAGRVNGVAQRHGHVSRELWQDLWPGRSQDEVPIAAITNGVHVGTWMANPVMAFLDSQFGPAWADRVDDPALWESLRGLDSAGLWQVHLELKQHLMTFIREEARRRYADRWRQAAQVVSAGTLLDPNAFTIGFARRFATYKRADLLFRDPERLRQLLVDPWRPVQIIIAGKAHPADDPGKGVLQTVHQFTHDPFFEGRVAFLEDYEMHMAHVLVQGVDLWLNMPRVPLEASGTSGMKAALNGVPQLSTIDGWWEEAYDGSNGWAIPLAPDAEDHPGADDADGEALYRLLEDEIVPLYYDRDEQGVPVGWVNQMRNAMRVAGSRFSARRMVQDYTERFYVPAMRNAPFADDPPGRHP